MNKLFGYILTPIFLVLFLGILVLFHPFLYLAYNIFGYTAHKRVLEWMNFSILWALRFIGTSFKFSGSINVPEGSPIIVVSNHQSMYDVPILLLAFRRYHPKFISKVELSRGIPSISYALRHMGSVLIKRSDHAQALNAIAEFGKEVESLGHTACIFPEGTRARDGTMKAFKPGGLTTLLTNMPTAQIVPVAIDGSWKILRYNFWPVPFGTKVRIEIMPPMSRMDESPRDICKRVESTIRIKLGEMQGTAAIDK